MHIEPRHYIIIKDILKKYPYTFYAFGSRVKGNHKKFSDLDLCFFEDIPGNIKAHIDEEFENSDLPYKVDLVNWDSCSIDFKKLIKNDLTCVQSGLKNIDIENLLNNI